MRDDTHIIKSLIDNFLIDIGLTERAATILDGWVVLLLIILLALLVNAFLRWGVVRGVRWVISHTRVKWDDFIFDDSVIYRLCGIVTPVVVSLMLPLLFAAMDGNYPMFRSLLSKAVDIYMLVCVL